MEDETPSFTLKQSAFIEAYVGEARGNARKAAEIAGYEGNDHTLAQVGYENLRKPDIRARIDQVLAERAMTASEVLAGLTEHARATIGHFIDPNDYDMPEEASGHLHLVRRVKKKVKSGGSGDRTWREVEIEIEIVDAQAALNQLGRHHKLFTDRVEAIDPNIDDKIEAELALMEATREAEAAGETEE